MMLNKKYHYLSLFSLLALSAIFAGGCANAVIKATPDQREIIIGSDPDSIQLTAPYEVKSLSLSWQLNGPGSLVGDTTAPQLVYKAPDKTNQKNINAHIQLTARKNNNEEELYHIWFQLVSPDASSGEDENDEDYKRYLSNESPDVVEFVELKQQASDYCNKIQKTSSSRRTEIITKLAEAGDRCYENYIYQKFEASNKNFKTDYGGLYQRIEFCLLPALKENLDKSFKNLNGNKYFLELKKKLANADSSSSENSDAEKYIILVPDEKKSLVQDMEEGLMLMENTLKLYQRTFTPDQKILDLRKALQKEIDLYKSILERIE